MAITNNWYKTSQSYGYGSWMSPEGYNAESKDLQDHSRIARKMLLKNEVLQKAFDFNNMNKKVSELNEEEKIELSNKLNPYETLMDLNWIRIIYLTGKDKEFGMEFKKQITDQQKKSILILIKQQRPNIIHISRSIPSLFLRINYNQFIAYLNNSFTFDDLKKLNQYFDQF